MIPKKMKKNIWAVQSLYEIVLSLVIIVPRNLGIQTVVKEISNMEKFLRKKYIGVCRWESTKVRMMMVKFPVTLNTYVMIKKRKVTVWSSGSSDSPEEWILWVLCGFSFLILFSPLLKQKMYAPPTGRKKC